MADRLAGGLSGIVDRDRDAPAQHRLSPSRMGLLARSDPWQAGGGCEYTLAAMPHQALGEGGSLPSTAWRLIGTAAPTAVAQPQAVQRLAESVPCTFEGGFRVTSTWMSNAHLWIGIGHADPGPENSLPQHARAAPATISDPSA